MHNLRSSELANAAELRARALPLRVASAVFLSILLHLVFQWPLVWLWAAAYVGSCVLELFVGQRLVSRLDGHPAASGALYIATVALSAALYGSISVPLLLLEHTRDGEVIGVVMLAGGLLSGLTASRTSWAPIWPARCRSAPTCC
jgi:hypothetical protein